MLVRHPLFLPKRFSSLNVYKAISVRFLILLHAGNAGSFFLKILRNLPGVKRDGENVHQNHPHSRFPSSLFLLVPFFLWFWYAAKSFILLILTPCNLTHWLLFGYPHHVAFLLKCMTHAIASHYSLTNATDRLQLMINVGLFITVYTIFFAKKCSSPTDCNCTIGSQV